MPYKRPGTANWGIVVSGVRRSSGTSSYEAADALEKQLNGVYTYAEPVKNPKAHSWRALCVAWMQERKNKKSWADDEAKIEWFDSHFGNIEDIATITRPLLDEIMQKNRRADPEIASPNNSTANRYVGLVSAMINFAARPGSTKHARLGWLEFPQVFRRYPEPDGRDMWLTVEQWQALLAELPTHNRLPATLAIATGLREAKVLGLEWRQIDFKNRTLTFTGTMNKRGNTIPLNSVALGVLIEAKQVTPLHMTRVFTYMPEGAANRFNKIRTPQPLTRPGQAFYKAMRRAKLGDWIADDQGALHWEGFCWHGFRHTFATWLRDTDAPDWALDALCGWVTPNGQPSGRFASGATRERYAHGLADKAREFSERVAELMQGKRQLTVKQA